MSGTNSTLFWYTDDLVSLAADARLCDLWPQWLPIVRNNVRQILLLSSSTFFGLFETSKFGIYMFQKTNRTVFLLILVLIPVDPPYLCILRQIAITMHPLSLPQCCTRSLSRPYVLPSNPPHLLSWVVTLSS